MAWNQTCHLAHKIPQTEIDVVTMNKVFPIQGSNYRTHTTQMVFVHYAVTSGKLYLVHNTCW